MSAHRQRRQTSLAIRRRPIAISMDRRQARRPRQRTSLETGRPLTVTAMATPSEHLLRRPITLATQPRHIATVMATQRAQPGRTPIFWAIPTLPIPIITAGPPGPLPHQPTSLATQPRRIVIAMARHRGHPHLPPTILETAVLNNEATTRTRQSGRGSPISRKMLLPKSHLGDLGRTKLNRSLLYHSAGRFSFPSHQAPRQADFLRLPSYPIYIITFSHVIIKLAKEGSTNTGTLLVDGIKQRIGDVLYALHGSLA